MKLALAQMLVEGGRVEENVARAGARIAEAAGCGADVVLLPEALDCGWTHPSAMELAGEVPGGRAFNRLAEAAREYGVWVCAGLVERMGDRLYNSAVLLDRRGAIKVKHRKINELDIGREMYAVGCENELSVCESEFGVLGVHICADAFAPGQVISRALCRMGARVILSPCAWAVDADHDNADVPYGTEWRDCYAPVSREFACWIAGCSCVGWMDAGPWAGRKCIGNSIVYDANGREVVTGRYGVDADVVLWVDL